MNDRDRLLADLLAACQARRTAKRDDRAAVIRRERAHRALVEDGLTMRQVADLSVATLRDAGFTTEDIDAAGVKYGTVRRAIERPIEP